MALGYDARTFRRGLTGPWRYRRDHAVELSRYRPEAGQTAEVGGYSFTFLSEHSVSGPNYQGEQGTFRVMRDGQTVALLRPESRVYKGGMPTSESAISWKPTHDIYVAMGQPIGDSAWSVRLQVRPFVRFIWIGGLLIALGGLLALTDPRYRRRSEARLPQGAAAETP